MAPILSATLIALSIISTAVKPADAQAPPPCDLATLFTHLGDIQGMCCSDGNECSSGYPGADDACSRECGELFEPFWDSEFYSLWGQSSSGSSPSGSPLISLSSARRRSVH